MPAHRLPPELVTQVVSYLGPDLVPYATISREWQAAVERQEFAAIKLHTPERLAEFHEIVAQNRQRRSYLRKLEVLIQLEPYSAEARARFETAEEHGRNNKIFVDWLQTVLKSLALWSEDGGANVELRLQAQSPGDAMDRERSRTIRKDPEMDLGFARCRQSYLYISQDELEDVPPVNAVSLLALTGHQRLVSPASCCYLATKLPQLRTVNLRLSDNEKRDPKLRKRNREELTNSMHLWPALVREFQLAFPHFAPQNERLAPENILNGASYDRFSVCLRDLSQQLKTIDLVAMLGRELFWPLEAEKIASSSLPYWPNLIKCKVCFIGATPAGTWLFEENPAEKDDEPYGGTKRWDELPEYLWPPIEDRNAVSLRTKAAPELIRDLYTSAGRAAQRMPRLQHMQLKCTLTRGSHQFDYIINGESALATWRNTVTVEPEDEVLQVWRDAAFQHTGTENGIEFKVELVGGGFKQIS